MIRADIKLIESVQAAYLWLYDRTGVYAATVLVALYAVSAFSDSMRRPLSWWDMFFLALFFIVMLDRYYQQNTDKLDKFNHDARGWQKSVIRWAFTVFLVVLIPLDVWRTKWWDVMGDVSLMLLFYMLCVQIRKREPPEKHVLAPQGSR